MNVLSNMLLWLGEQLQSDALAERFKETNLELNHPIGSYYFTDDVNDLPAERFGGVWSRVQGRFLVGAGNNGKSGDEALNLDVGEMGGESKHRLAANESGIAQHNHAISGTSGWTAVAITKDASLSSAVGKVGSGSTAKYLGITPTSQSYHQISNTANKSATQASASHNNLPPYKAVAIWVRTA